MSNIQYSVQEQTQAARRLPLLGYLLYLFGILFGITALIGVIVNHIKLPQTRDHCARSHLVWQIFSFWILFAGIALVVILWPNGYSTTLAYGCLLWWVVSALTGIHYLLNKKPIPFIKLPSSD